MKVVSRRIDLIPRNKSYHWLGDGIYFWENDPHRALEWAQEKSSRGELEDPFVIGAAIDMGRCLDLHSRDNQKLLVEAHADISALFAAAGKPMPKNKKAPKDDRDDDVLRFLDCAVINHLNTLLPPFDTVRGLFIEGDPIYSGAKLFNKTHSEIAVRNLSCIKGCFIPDQAIVPQTLFVQSEI